jgi:hypothetical protein
MPTRRSSFGADCAHCGKELIAPERSEYRDERHVLHIWRCPKCDRSFEVIWSADAKSVADIGIFLISLLAPISIKAAMSGAGQQGENIARSQGVSPRHPGWPRAWLAARGTLIADRHSRCPMGTRDAQRCWPFRRCLMWMTVRHYPCLAARFGGVSGGNETHGWRVSCNGRWRNVGSPKLPMATVTCTGKPSFSEKTVELHIGQK